MCHDNIIIAIYEKRIKSGEYKRVDMSTIQLCLDAHIRGDSKKRDKIKETYIKNTGISEVNFWYAFSIVNLIKEGG